MADSFGPVHHAQRAGVTTGRPGPDTGSVPDDPGAEPIRVLVVDDHALFRRGLEIVLAQEEDIQVVGRPETARRPSTRPPTCCPTSF